MDLLYKITIFPIERFMELCLGGLYSFSGDYGTSLILLSLFINIMLIPVYRLADKWQESEKSIQDRMSREIDTIKRYYSGKKRYFQIKTVHRRYGYNPLLALRVSLGFLIQIPFFFAAYHLLSNYQNLNGVSFLFINNLGAPDHYLYKLNILPLLMTAINIASVLIYTKNMTTAQKMQLHSLPILFLFVLYNMPSGLILYWTMNNVFSLIKNIITVIKKQNESAVKPKFAIRSLPEIFDFLIISRYSRYSVFVMLFSVAALLTFYCLSETRYAQFQALAMLSMKTSIFLLFVIIAIIAPGFVKRYTKSFQSFILFYVATLLITGIGTISMSTLKIILIKKLGIITRSTHLMIFFLLPVIFMLLYHFFRLLRDKYGTNILESSLSALKYDKRNFTLTVILFNMIFFIWGPSLTMHSAAADEFYIKFIYILLWQILFFLTSFVVIYSIHFIMPRPVKTLLTFTLQYVSVLAIIYLVFNQRGVGLMDHFVLVKPDVLNMDPHELFLEVFLLYFVLACLYLAVRYAPAMMNRVMYLLMTIIFLISVYYSFIVMQNQSSKKETVSLNKYELTLSKDKSNVFIIIFDAYSGGAVQHLLNVRPGLFESMEGFTWYKNTLTTSTGTWGSMAALYGGHKYNIENINDNSFNVLRNDYSDAYNFYNREFTQHGYIAKYVNPTFVRCNNIDSNAECYGLKSRSGKTTSEDWNSKTGNPPAYKMSLLVNAVTLFKSMPHMYQQHLYDDGAWLGIVEKHVLAKASYKRKQWNYLFNLKDRIKVVKKPTISLIKMSIPHPSSIMDANCEFTENDIKNYFNDAYCAIVAFKQISQGMKELGVYDNTLIVLVADHGYWIKNQLFDEKSFTKKVPPGLENRLMPGFINPLLMVKDINAKNNFRISDKFMSNSDVASIVCTAIGSCKGIPPDYRKYNAKRVLTINLYVPENELEFLSKTGFGYVEERYEVTDNIFDASNWKKTF